MSLLIVEIYYTKSTEVMSGSKAVLELYYKK